MYLCAGELQQSRVQGAGGKMQVTMATSYALLNGYIILSPPPPFFFCRIVGPPAVLAHNKHGWVSNVIFLFTPILL